MENSNPTQCNRVLEYIKQHGSITQYDAFFDLGIMRLASRISELRKKHGYSFSWEWVEVRNRFDEVCRVKKYMMGGDDDGKQQTGCDDLLRDRQSH